MGRRPNDRGCGKRYRRNDESGRTSYEPINKTNEKLEKLYNTLDILPEDERDAFWAALRGHLPISFRFTGSRSHALTVRQCMIDRYIPKLAQTIHKGEIVDPPKPVPWYPDQLAWAMDVPKTTIRKSREFEDFARFLHTETVVGNINRQELVSMVPVLLLDVQNNHTVLDMCAAPGSKSGQILEMLHAGEEARVRKAIRDHELQLNGNSASECTELGHEGAHESAGVAESDQGRSTGLLVANDVNHSRLLTLIHQTKRLNSPNFMVTQHNAEQYPSIRIPSDNKAPQYMKFDRILADVPCSGDGTLKKNPAIWKNWVPGMALGVHPLQIRILVRALQMLKVGGRAVYSTCSLNPVENEAVVATVIQHCGGNSKVRLLDCSHELPGLKRRPGLRSWKIMDKRGDMWSSWDEYESAKNSEADEIQLSPSMFPPSATDEISRIPLENCIRIYPHLQDTGGFFVAVLEKLAHISVSLPSFKRPRDEVFDDLAESAPAKRAKFEDDGMDFNVDQGEAKTSNQNGAVRGTKTAKNKKGEHDDEFFEFLAPDHPELQKVYDFYELPKSFPRDRWMVRNPSGEPAKVIYYTSAQVRDILVANKATGMRFVHAGVKMFQKQDAQAQDVCRWRIQLDGLPVVEPCIGASRIVHCSKRETLHLLLKEMFPKVAQQPDWERFGEIGETLRALPMGCAVLRIEPSDDPNGFQEHLAFPLWRSIASINLMLPNEDRRAALRRLFNDESPLINHSLPATQPSQKKSKTSNNKNNQRNGAVGGQSGHDGLADDDEYTETKENGIDDGDGDGDGPPDTNGQDMA